jgi:hypothetical protein
VAIPISAWCGLGQLKVGSHKPQEGHQGDPREQNCKFLARPRSAAGGRAEQSIEEHTPCFHCLDTGWFMLTAENDFGELEDYFVLWRKCKEA